MFDDIADRTSSRMTVDQFAAVNGYAAGADLPDGRVAFLLENITGGEIAIGAEATQIAGVSERYSYRTMYLAAAAWSEWGSAGYVGEPDDWIRHLMPIGAPHRYQRRAADGTIYEAD